VPKHRNKKFKNTQKTKTETELVAIFWREKKRQKIATRNLKTMMLSAGRDTKKHIHCSDFLKLIFQLYDTLFCSE